MGLARDEASGNLFEATDISPRKFPQSHVPSSVVDEINLWSRVDLDLSIGLDVQCPALITLGIVPDEGHVTLYLHLRPNHLKVDGDEQDRLRLCNLRKHDNEKLYTCWCIQPVPLLSL